MLALVVFAVRETPAVHSDWPGEMLCAQLAVLKASRERDRDLLNRQSTETRDTADELMGLRAKLRDAELLAEDRLSDLDDTRRRCPLCAASCSDL